MEFIYTYIYIIMFRKRKLLILILDNNGSFGWSARRFNKGNHNDFNRTQSQLGFLLCTVHQIYHQIQKESEESTQIFCQILIFDHWMWTTMHFCKSVRPAKSHARSRVFIWPPWIKIYINTRVSLHICLQIPSLSNIGV